MSLVVDASAVLAMLLEERGGDAVAEICRGARLSAVNLSEVMEKAAHRVGDPSEVMGILAGVGINVIPFDAIQAAKAATLKPRLVGKDISLADRACLALGATSNLPIYTADTVWASLELDLDIHLIR